MPILNRLTHSTQIPLTDLDKESFIEALPIQGKLPPWLEGTLIRNGPAKFHFGEKAISHWFDGLAMLHAFTFGAGKIAYRNKFIRSDAYHLAMEKNDLHFMGFMQDPCISVFKRLFAYFLPSLTPTIIQNANVNVMRIAENYVALTETPLPVCFDPKTLETKGALQFKDALCKSNCFESAHPHHDPSRQETISFQITIGRKGTYCFYTVSDKGPAVRKPFYQMESDRASYIHSFAITEQYLVLIEYPLVLKPLDLLLKGGGYISHFTWEPERGSRVHLIHRREGRLIRSYETDPFFCFHHVNAYEERGLVNVDFVQYPDAKIVFGDPGNQKRKLIRLRLDPHSSTIQTEILAETLLELPRLYYQRYNTKPYKYVYGVGFHYSEPIPLQKIDVSSGAILEWKESGALAGEPVFVPSPHGEAEDDGILLSVVTSPLENRSFLLILRAQDMQEIGRAEVNHLIPYGLHGMFFR